MKNKLILMSALTALLFSVHMRAEEEQKEPQKEEEQQPEPEKEQSKEEVKENNLNLIESNVDGITQFEMLKELIKRALVRANVDPTKHAAIIEHINKEAPATMAIQAPAAIGGTSVKTAPIMLPKLVK